MVYGLLTFIHTVESDFSLLARRAGPCSPFARTSVMRSSGYGRVRPGRFSRFSLLQLTIRMGRTARRD
ncbi:hypothetical protein BVI2075_530067 [Burkholderia vietnamiensis]|nr:hypothetical protein BVI2075_530067 [Burkholderia vietnamiensis]